MGKTPMLVNSLLPEAPGEVPVVGDFDYLKEIRFKKE
jgi:hypothetical protein